MPWMGPARAYYYRRKRIGGRIQYQYVGTGAMAELVAQMDALDQEQRALGRQEEHQRRAAFVDMVQAPPELVCYAAEVRATVATVLQRLGFHQHKRGEWRRKRMTNAIETRTQRAMDLYCRDQLTTAEQRELRTILTEHTALAKNNGDMFHVAWVAFMTPLGKVAPGLRVAVEARTAQLRHEFGYDESSALEKLLIDEIVLCHFDLYRIQRQYGIATSNEFSLASLQEWDKALNQKQARYLRAIEALARVRRLLKLPTMQININQAGGQQLNVAGQLNRGE